MLPRPGVCSSRTSVAQEFRDAAEFTVDLRSAQHHEAVDGAPQVKRFGAAGDDPGQEILGNGDEITRRAGLHLEMGVDVARQPEQSGGFKRNGRSAQCGGAASRLDHEQMRAPDRHPDE